MDSEWCCETQFVECFSLSTNQKNVLRLSPSTVQCKTLWQCDCLFPKKQILLIICEHVQSYISEAIHMAFAGSSKLVESIYNLSGTEVYVIQSRRSSCQTTVLKFTIFFSGRDDSQGVDNKWKYAENPACWNQQIIPESHWNHTPASKRYPLPPAIENMWMCQPSRSVYL